MNGIEKELQDLITTYDEQLRAYKKIQSLADQENDLIKNGQIEQLLKVLEEKQASLRTISEDEGEIRRLQDSIRSHYSLEQFSIPRMMAAAAQDERPALQSLQKLVAELLLVLEALEQQEKQHERLLKEYGELVSGLSSRKIGTHHAGRAVEAYKKGSESNRTRVKRVQRE